jgi:hypothetical protein
VVKGIVMLAEASIQDVYSEIKRVKIWIPVFTGMTKGEDVSTLSRRFVESFSLEFRGSVESSDHE